MLFPKYLALEKVRKVEMFEGANKERGHHE
jgi:hypothetical protein